MSQESPPNSPPRGPIGWFPFLGPVGDYSRNPFQFFESNVKKYGPAFTFKMAGLDFSVLSSPESVEQVLIKNYKKYNKGPILAHLQEVFGNGLLTNEGETWKRHRLLVQPAFSRAQITRYESTVIQATQNLAARWASNSSQSLSRQQVQAIQSDMMGLTLDIIVNLLFGSEIQSRTLEIGELFKEIMDYFEFSISPMGQVLKKIPAIPNPRRRRYLDATRSLDLIVSSLVHQRANSAQNDQNPNLLDRLIEAQLDDQSKFSAADLRDELMTLFIAGHETTAVALTFSLALLAKNPDIQSKLRSDLLNLSEEASYESQELKNVINESLRIYPPVWTIGRECIESHVISNYMIPVGTLVLIPIWVMHRNPKYFPDPEQFKPSRWTHAFQQSLPKGAYIPFGAGPRACIGAGFAMMELQIILATLVRRFRFELIDEREMQIAGTLTARPRHELKLGVWPTGY